jgi:hypothetical protein
MAIMDNMHPFHGYKFRTDEEELKIAVSQGTLTEAMDRKWPGLVFAINDTLPKELAARTEKDQKKWVVNHLEYVKGVLTVHAMAGSQMAEPFTIPISKDKPGETVPPTRGATADATVPPPEGEPESKRHRRESHAGA